MKLGTLLKCLSLINHVLFDGLIQTLCNIVTFVTNMVGVKLRFFVLSYINFHISQEEMIKYVSKSALCAQLWSDNDTMTARTQVRRLT